MSHILYSQSILSGLGIEVGGGHNQLFWKAPIPTLQSPNESNNRTDLSFTPTVRLNYHWDIASPVSVIPFIGYDQFGGKVKYSNGYQDQFWFDAVECGVSGMYSVDDFSFGVGLKANYNLKVTGRWLGGVNAPPSANTSWTEIDITSWFKRWSGDAGARASYRYGHFSINLESWFGITELQTGFFSPATIRENQYRMLVGYTL
jgi:hypothetical protein